MSYAFIAILAASLFALPCEAQTPDLAEVLRRAASQNAFLKISLSDSSVYEGRLASITPSMIRLGDRQIDLSTINRVEKRISKNSGARKGAIIGAVAAFALTLPLRGFVSDPDSNGDESDANILSVEATAVGAIVGLLAGGVIHPGTASWLRLWP